MNLLTNPPTDPSKVVIVVQRLGTQVLAMAFKYKKGRWVGQASGEKYTTEELVNLDAGHAGWIESPLQPIYNKE